VALTERVRAWRERGQNEEFRGYGIHTFRHEGEGPLLLLLHGFPSSSYDWRLLLEQELPANVFAFDFLGFGLSDKPRDSDYSLFWQADLAEELVRRHGEGRPVFILAHDMGTSVANELMARDLEGKLEMDVAGIVLFNGSMVLAVPSARSSPGSPASASSATSSARSSPPRTRSARRRPRTSGRWSATTAAAPSATGSSLIWTSANDSPSAGTARSASGPGRSASPGACLTRWRRRRCWRRCASCGRG
jgi:pimeloyl-ACP methyl ester carboxylesterase